MRGVVLKFQRSPVNRRQAKPDSGDILKILTGLRSDLRYIDKAIVAVERLAVTQLGEDAWRARTGISRKKGERAPTAKRKLQAVTLRLLPRSELTRKDPLTVRADKAVLPVSSVG